MDACKYRLFSSGKYSDDVLPSNCDSFILQDGVNIQFLKSLSLLQLEMAQLSPMDCWKLSGWQAYYLPNRCLGILWGRAWERPLVMFNKWLPFLRCNTLCPCTLILYVAARLRNEDTCENDNQMFFIFIQCWNKPTVSIVAVFGRLCQLFF